MSLISYLEEFITVETKDKIPEEFNEISRQVYIFTENNMIGLSVFFIRDSGDNEKLKTKIKQLFPDVKIEISSNERFILFSMKSNETSQYIDFFRKKEFTVKWYLGQIFMSFRAFCLNIPCRKLDTIATFDKYFNSGDIVIYYIFNIDSYLIFLEIINNKVIREILLQLNSAISEDYIIMLQNIKYLSKAKIKYAIDNNNILSFDD